MMMMAYSHSRRLFTHKGGGGGPIVVFGGSHMTSLPRNVGTQRFSTRKGTGFRKNRLGARTQHQRKPSQSKDTNVNKEASHIPENGASKTPTPAWTQRIQLTLERLFAPVRFVAMNKESVTKKGMTVVPRHWHKDEYLVWAQRFPLAVVLVGLCLWDETAPLSIVQLRGPSMLPTMAPDQSEIWIAAPMQSVWRRWAFTPKYKHDDLVGFTSPQQPTGSSEPQSSPRAVVSCKRIVGLPGDTVQRYGAFVHLYVPQDAQDWGILWPPFTQSTDWAQDSRWRSNRNPRDTIVVPPNHVWLEADCPGLGLDSRQLGPIPMSSIQCRIWGRLWPLWRSKMEAPLYSNNIRQRPHPIPLDEDTLRLYNVHRMMPARS